MAIHSGMLTGMFKAKITPVTQAERSPTGLGLCISLQYRYSKTTQARVVTAVSRIARMPKISPDATMLGTSAISTLPIRPRVVALSRIWGEAVTIRRSSIPYFPPLRSSPMYQAFARPMFWATGRLAGQA